MYDEKQFGTTDDEMNAYPALCIIMTVVNKHTIKMNWSERSILQTFVFDVRFVLISRLLFCTQLQMRIINL